MHKLYDSIDEQAIKNQKLKCKLSKKYPINKKILNDKIQRMSNVIMPTSIQH